MPVSGSDDRAVKMWSLDSTGASFNARLAFGLVSFRDTLKFFVSGHDGAHLHAIDPVFSSHLPALSVKAAVA